MSFTKIKDIEKLSEFSNQESQLIELERQKIYDADSFFQDILDEPFRVIGKVYKKDSNEDIQKIFTYSFILLKSPSSAFFNAFSII